MISYGDIRQLAGLLEGEAWFGFGEGTPTIALKMADQDVVAEAARVLGITRPLWLDRSRERLGHKRMYGFRLCGADAAGWMMTLYRHLCARRRKQVVGALAKWRTAKTYTGRRTHCQRGHAYDEANTLAYVNKKGRFRVCRACFLAWHSRYYYEHRVKGPRVLARCSQGW